jgi:hypothetical protein
MGRYRYQKSRAKHNRAKHKRFLGSSWRLTQFAFVMGVSLPLFLFAWKWGRSPKPPCPSSARSAILTPKHASPNIRLADASRPVRRLLPYSVIPGGAVSVEELKSALTNDPVVAGHYADFDAARARVVQVDHDRAVYVSYRLGNHVYWTTKRLRLLKGETVLSDGEHQARTRCGNRISDTPRQPVSLKEPQQAVLDNPQLPTLPEAIPEWSFPLGDLILPSPPVGELEPPTGGIFVPPVIPLWGGGGGGGGTLGGTTVPTTPDSPTPPPTPTPEPASILLLSSGLLGLWLRRKRPVDRRF